LIASSTKINIGGGGAINAQGGHGGNNYGGGGSGGAIRLVSNIVGNSGNIYAGGGGRGNGSTIGNGGDGTVRLEAFNLTTGQIEGNVYTSIPYNLALPVGGPSTLSVTSVNGIAVYANPFSFPDATVATSSSVPVVISGVNIPPGTTGNLYVFTENAPDQAIPFTLTGTLVSTTVTLNVTYPAGGSRGFAKVTWTGQ
jgi:hypothetical protein